MHAKITVKTILCVIVIVLFPLSVSWAEGQWEKQGNYYYLTKTTRQYFNATAAGSNKFPGKYMTYNGVDFLARGANEWKDYGRLNLEGNNFFAVPIRAGMDVEEIHLLIGGNVGNRYEHDSLLRVYGDNYYYAVLTLIFAYQDGAYRVLSVPVFWDWFHVGPGEWSKDGARIISLGNNPVRKDCTMFHVIFANPRPLEPVKDILLTDSWLSDKPSSEIFALTLKSFDTLESIPRENRQFEIPANTAVKEPADKRTAWMFDNDLDGWIAGCSGNWDADAAWQADAYGRKGVAVIPACNWAGDKFSWIEKKVALPDWDKIKLQFLRHSAAYSEQDKQWTDGLLRVTVRGNDGKETTVYEMLYPSAGSELRSGAWSVETADLSQYKGQTVIIRFENHGAGTVRLSQTTAPACDAEDALIDEISLMRGQ